MRFARDIAASPPLQPFVLNELSPGEEIQSDNDLLDYARDTGVTLYHPVGTCKMGTDVMAVVDPELKVRGLQGIRSSGRIHNATTVQWKYKCANNNDS